MLQLPRQGPEWPLAPLLSPQRLQQDSDRLKYAPSWAGHLAPDAIQAAGSVSKALHGLKSVKPYEGPQRPLAPAGGVSDALHGPWEPSPCSGPSHAKWRLQVPYRPLEALPMRSNGGRAPNPCNRPSHVKGWPQLPRQGPEWPLAPLLSPQRLQQDSDRLKAGRHGLAIGHSCPAGHGLSIFTRA